MPHKNPDPTDTYADDADDDLDLSPSKTQLKKQMHELQTLGKELLEMPAARLDPLDLPETLRDALEELRRTRSHEGRRRQLQYVGKLMRKVDPAPLREAVAAWRVPGARETLALHEAERWRERLLGDDNALTEWLDRHPGSDVQALRTLIRNARKEATQAAAAQPHDGAVERKGRAYRDLFQIIRQTLAASARTDSPTDPDPQNENDNE